MLTTALLLQTLLPLLALGAPLSTTSGNELHITDNAVNFGTGGGVLGFIVLVLDILVWIELFKSKRPPLHKLLWALLVFIFPIVGVIIYWLLSDRKKQVQPLSSGSARGTRADTSPLARRVQAAQAEDDKRAASNFREGVETQSLTHGSDVSVGAGKHSGVEYDC